MRRRRNRDVAAGDGVKCRMCGQAVVVGGDGRCPLGHAVGVPAPAAADAAPQPTAVQEPQTLPESEAVPGVGDPGTTPPAAEQAAHAPVAPAPSPPRPAASPQAGAAAAPVTGSDIPSDLFAAFDELDTFADLGDRNDSGAADPDETQDLLADLGRDPADGSAPTPATTRPPATTPPPPPAPSDDLPGRDPGAGSGDLLDWDAALSALDTEVPVTDAGAGTAGQPGPDDAAAEPDDEADDGADPDSAMVEDEEALEAEDRKVARRRVLGIVGGTAAATATVVGSVLLLPL